MFSEKEHKEALIDYKKAREAGIIPEGQVKWMSAKETQKVTVILSNPPKISQFSQEYGASYPMCRSAGHNLWPLKLVTKIFELARDGDSVTKGNPITGEENGKTGPDRPAGWSSGIQDLLKRVLPLSSGENEVQPTQNQPFELVLHTHTPVQAVLPAPSISTFKWSVQTERGILSTNRVVYATNAYTSHLLPHLSGPAGIVPVRGQVVAIRAEVGYIDEGWEGTGEKKGLSRSGWSGNEGFEYWFPRPHPTATSTAPPQESKRPLIILGGGRETLRNGGYGMYETDDSILDPEVSTGLRVFLGNVFPGKFPHGNGVDDAVEVEWVSFHLSESLRLTPPIVWYYGIYQVWRSICELPVFY